LRQKGKGRFDVFSAGVKPQGAPHPVALAILRDNFQIDASDARSKSVDEFQNVQFDFVITVCDNARKLAPSVPEDRLLPTGPAPIRRRLREIKTQ
jgi:arsenate reductase (thioredoxin)